jgi:hypothetical protein
MIVTADSLLSSLFRFETKQKSRRRNSLCIGLVGARTDEQIQCPSEEPTVTGVTVKMPSCSEGLASRRKQNAHQTVREK